MEPLPTQSLDNLDHIGPQLVAEQEAHRRAPRRRQPQLRPVGVVCRRVGGNAAPRPTAKPDLTFRQTRSEPFAGTFLDAQMRRGPAGGADHGLTERMTTGGGECGGKP
jgi:hypothetical protein